MAESSAYEESGDTELVAPDPDRFKAKQSSAESGLSNNVREQHCTWWCKLHPDLRMDQSMQRHTFDICSKMLANPNLMKDEFTEQLHGRGVETAAWQAASRVSQRTSVPHEPEVIGTTRPSTSFTDEM